METNFSYQGAIKNQLELLRSENREYKKLITINNIIELKVLSQQEELTNDLYFWTKKYISTSIGANEEIIGNYYLLDKDKILHQVERNSIAEQVGLIKFCIRELKKLGYEHEAIWFDNLKSKKELKLLWFNFQIKKLPNIITKIATYDLLSTLISVSVVYVFYSLLLFPVQKPFLLLFRIESVKYSKYFCLNHMLNTMLSFFEIDSEFKITTLNWMGIFVLVLMKIFLFTIIYKFLTESLKKYFNN